MKRFIYILIILFISMSVFANGTEEDGDVPVIGISKIVSHPALDAVEQGIKDEISEQGIEARYDSQNANGDISTAATIARKFVADKVDIAVGIATPTAQALVNAIKDIPVVYTAVTDPVSAGLVKSYAQGAANVTGISDLTPVHEQIVFLQSIYPIQTLGHIYSSGEDNAVTLAGLVNESVEELALDYREATVAGSAEVRSAFLSIADNIDALYISTDNTVVSALASVLKLAEERGIAIMSADPSSATEMGGVLAAWGFDYYKLGRATGNLIIRILKGEKTSSIPTIYMSDPSDSELFINLDVAKKLGISIPANVIDSATTIIENGEKRKQ